PKRFATWFFVGLVAGGNEIADGAETDKLQWFLPDEALAAQAAGEVELAPPPYGSLRDLPGFDPPAAGLGAGAGVPPVGYLPRFPFVEGGDAMCIYPEDVAYDDLSRLDAPGPRHRLYLRSGDWEYVRD